MDFIYHYPEKQERFRQEVRAWLEENVSQEMREPTDPADFTEKQYWYWREKHKELAKKGWLYPTYPQEYGGGGLTVEEAVIIGEEFQKARVARAANGNLILGALLVYGTEEQKQRFLVPFLKAEMTSWEKFTEPHSGADLADYQSTAVRDGDEWVLNGSNVFVSGRGEHPDCLWGLAKTDPNAPRHRNLGFFMIPCPTPGLTIRRMNLVMGRDQHFIFLDNVRVPANNLIGHEHQGWQIANTVLEEEHGAAGEGYHEFPVTDNLLSYMQQQRQKGLSPGGDVVLHQTAIEAYIGARISRLFKMRAHWMYMNKLVMTWEGTMQFYWQRLYGFQNTARVRDVMGMYALLDKKELIAPHGGAQEFYQRDSFIFQHGAGSFNITKVIMARRIGISRTKERAAPTRMTAGSKAS